MTDFILAKLYNVETKNITAMSKKKYKKILRRFYVSNVERII
tara:strand:- start:5923 stop:6048 length:126 start_codon:yes stop_codon:yes gene_type:complete